MLVTTESLITLRPFLLIVPESLPEGEMCLVEVLICC